MRKPRLTCMDGHAPRRFRGVPDCGTVQHAARLENERLEFEGKHLRAYAAPFSDRKLHDLRTGRNLVFWHIVYTPHGA
jgi:hypothetical protein